MGKSLNSRPASSNPRPGKSLISNASIKDRIKNRSAQSQPSGIAQQAASQPAQQPAQKTVAAKDRVYKQAGNAVTEEGLRAFINMMEGLVSPFAILDENTIAKNMELAAGNGMSAADRTVPYECAEYVITNLPYIFMGMVLSNDFKDAFVKAVSIELSFDEQSDEVKAQTRKGMSNGSTADSIGSVVLGVTSFTKPIEQNLLARMNENFEKLSPHSGDFSAAVDKLTVEEKMVYGVIFSNFMYLIRAFTHNDYFMGYVVSVIEHVKKTMNIK